MYYVVYVPLYLFSLLPLRVLYLFSDITYFILYYLAGYRKEIVFANLNQAFPEKSAKERKSIAKKFYRNLTDAFIESVKVISISKKQIQKRGSGEFDLLNGLIAKGSNIHALVGHQFNWEFANLLYALNLDIPFVAIYMPLANKNLDRIFYNNRKRYGTILISAHDFRKVRHEVFSRQYSLALAADQNPSNPANAFWMNFLHKPAPFSKGPAKGAVRYKTAVVIASMEKVRRGRYSFRTALITEDGSQYTAEQLALIYKNELEKIIRKDPANYLWSHRRWRHEWKPEYGEIIG